MVAAQDEKERAEGAGDRAGAADLFGLLSGLAQKIAAAAALCFLFGLPAVHVQIARLGLPSASITVETVVRAGVLPTAAIAVALFMAGAAIRQWRRGPGDRSFTMVAVILLAAPALLAVFLIFLPAILLLYVGLFHASLSVAVALGATVLGRDPPGNGVVAGLATVLALCVFAAGIALGERNRRRQVGAQGSGQPAAPAQEPASRAEASWGPAIGLAVLFGLLVVALRFGPGGYRWLFEQFGLGLPVPQVSWADSVYATLELGLLGAVALCAMYLQAGDNQADDARRRALATTDEGQRRAAHRAWADWHGGWPRLRLVGGVLAAAFALILVALVHYTQRIYPALPALFGGGRADPATVWLKADAVPTDLPWLAPPACRRRGPLLGCRVSLAFAGSGQIILIGGEGAARRALLLRQDAVVLIGPP